MSYQSYLDSLPKKRMGSGCLFFDAAGSLLVLKPTYREDWLIPGGVVEADESPRAACIREVKEEIGLECEPQQLLCIDYISAIGNYSEAMQFVFWGGVITTRDVVLANDEICEYRFVAVDRALDLLGVHARRRIFWSLEGMKLQKTLYLENHERV